MQKSIIHNILRVCFPFVLYLLIFLFYLFSLTFMIYNLQLAIFWKLEQVVSPFIPFFCPILVYSQLLLVAWLLFPGLLWFFARKLTSAGAWPVHWVPSLTVATEQWWFCHVLFKKLESSTLRLKETHFTIRLKLNKCTVKSPGAAFHSDRDFSLW